MPYLGDDFYNLDGIRPADNVLLAFVNYLRRDALVMDAAVWNFLDVYKKRRATL